jgi:hypothetical protein
MPRIIKYICDECGEEIEDPQTLHVPYIVKLSEEGCDQIVFRDGYFCSLECMVVHLKKNVGKDLSPRKPQTLTRAPV